jgi:predicted RNase H-like nuclease (RuvC/YqgF family)
MNALFDQKNITVSAVNDLLLVLTNLETCDNDVINELNKKNESLNQMNKKLINEISEKDKHILELSEVKEEENKFGMIKAKDKEISNLSKEIKSLKKELEQANSKLELMSGDNSVSCEMDDVQETPVEDSSTPVEETPIEETPVEDSSTPIEETPVEEEEDDDGSDDIEYVIKKHKKVRYYVVKDDENSKMYEILGNGDVGDEVGELKDGKKVLY